MPHCLQLPRHQFPESRPDLKSSSSELMCRSFQTTQQSSKPTVPFTTLVASLRKIIRKRVPTDACAV
ncbi:hypothetical protein LZ30DRAFT_725035, partial [Colletotrichum cereale]